MGCGKSKHAVATENTLTKSKSKTLEKIPTVDVEVKKNDATDGIRAVQSQPDETEKKSDKVEEEKEILKKTEEKDEGKEKEVVDNHKNVESVVEGKVECAAVAVAAAAAVEEKKEEIKNEKLEGEDKENGAKEATDESVVSQEVSRTLENESPIISEVKVEGIDDAHKDTEDDTNKEKEEAVKAEEVKELAPAEETKSSEEEKTPADQNENGSGLAPTSDDKEN